MKVKKSSPAVHDAKKRKKDETVHDEDDLVENVSDAEQHDDADETEPDDSDATEPDDSDATEPDDSDATEPDDSDETEPDDSDATVGDSDELTSVSDTDAGCLIICNIPNNASIEDVAQWLTKRRVTPDTVELTQCAIVDVTDHKGDLKRIVGLDRELLGKGRVSVYHALGKSSDIKVHKISKTSKNEKRPLATDNTNEEEATTRNETSPPKMQRIESSNDSSNPPTIASNSKLFVRNLPFTASLEDVAKLFPGGAIELPMRHGKSHGFAYVQFGSIAEAEAVVERCNQNPVTVNDRQLTVQYYEQPAKSKKQSRSSTGRQKSAEQQRGSGGNRGGFGASRGQGGPRHGRGRGFGGKVSDNFAKRNAFTA